MAQNGVTLGTNVLLYAATVPNAGPVASLQFIVDGSSTSTPVTSYPYLPKQRFLMVRIPWSLM